MDLVNVEAFSLTSTLPQTLESNGTTVGEFRFTRSGTDNLASLTVNFTVGGTADPNPNPNTNDYGLDNFTVVTIPAGESFGSIFIAIGTDDDLVEEDETIVLTLEDGADYNLGTSPSATFTIIDNDTPIVTVDATIATGAESPNTDGEFTIVRTGGDISAALDIALSVNGTATSSAGGDYTPIPTMVTIAANETSVVIPVDVLDDDFVESAETVVATLTDGTDYDLGDSPTATVTINSDDVMAPQPPVRNVLYGAPDQNVLRIGDEDDFILGAAGEQFIFGDGGDDILIGDPEGQTGNDFMFGGPGRDTLLGEDGHDVMFGDEGDDVVFGGRGNDLLFGGTGFNFLYGGTTAGEGDGRDIFALTEGDGLDIIFDFNVGEDAIALTNGLNFGQIFVVQVELDTVIGTYAGDVMAVLENVDASKLGSPTFLEF